MTAPTEPRPHLAWDDFVTDAELIERINVPEKIARQAIEALDKNPGQSGFPQKQKLWGDRRYWPACKAYFYRASGLSPAETFRDRKSA